MSNSKSLRTIAGIHSNMRNTELDGLRGLAALAVALGHCNTVSTGVGVWSKSLADFPQMSGGEIFGRLGHVLFPADAAVLIFFVMSGYVLWSSLLRRNESALVSFAPYTISRLYRLLPVSIISTLLIGLGGNINATDLAHNAFLLSYSLNGVLWSLQVEVVGSFLIFFMFALTASRPWLLCLAFVATTCAAYYHPHQFLTFLPTFVLGASLHYLPGKIFRSPWLLAGAYITLILADLVLQRGTASKTVTFVSAWLLVGCIIQVKPAFLNRPIIQRLGEISYPFYLCHTIGLIYARVLLPSLPFTIPNQLALFIFLVTISLSISIPLSWLIHKLVEKPGMQAGSNIARALTDKIRRFVGGRSTQIESKLSQPLT